VECLPLPTPGASAQFADLLKKEQQRHEKLIDDAKIKPN